MLKILGLCMLVMLLDVCRCLHDNGLIFVLLHPTRKHKQTIIREMKPNQISKHHVDDWLTCHSNQNWTIVMYHWIYLTLDGTMLMVLMMTWRWRWRLKFILRKMERRIRRMHMGDGLGLLKHDVCVCVLLPKHGHHVCSSNMTICGKIWIYVTRFEQVLCFTSTHWLPMLMVWFSLHITILLWEPYVTLEYWWLHIHILSSSRYTISSLSFCVHINFLVLLFGWNISSGFFDVHYEVYCWRLIGHLTRLVICVCPSHLWENVASGHRFSQRVGL